MTTARERGRSSVSEEVDGGDGAEERGKNPKKYLILPQPPRRIAARGSPRERSGWLLTRLSGLAARPRSRLEVHSLTGLRLRTLEVRGTRGQHACYNGRDELARARLESARTAGVPGAHRGKRRLTLVRKGSFRHPRTTSAHMLEYLRYDIPAMRQ